MTRRAAERGLSQGQRLLRQGRWDEAERALEEAVAAAPEYRWPHLYLALARADGGRAKEALPAIGRAQELSPPSAVLLVFRARILCDGGRCEEAIEACRQALELDPGFTVARGYQALALLSRGAVAEAALRWGELPEEPPSALMGRMLLAAEQIVRQAPLPKEEPIALPEAEPGKPGERRRPSTAASAALKRARRAYARERLAEAQQADLEAVRADPGLAEAWLDLAVVSYELDACETARRSLERYRQAAGLEENDPQYRAYRAACEAKLRNPERALELLEGADPGQPVVPYTRGLALLALNRLPEARHAFIQFAGLLPRVVRLRLRDVMGKH